jgi:hypothetical protein
MKPTTASFIGAFTYKRGPLLQPWRDLSQDWAPQGDCESFAWTVLKLEAGGTIPAIKALVTRKAAIWPRWRSSRGRLGRGGGGERATHRRGLALSPVALLSL